MVSLVIFTAHKVTVLIITILYSENNVDHFTAFSIPIGFNIK